MPLLGLGSEGESNNGAAGVTRNLATFWKKVAKLPEDSFLNLYSKMTYGYGEVGDDTPQKVAKLPVTSGGPLARAGLPRLAALSRVAQPHAAGQVRHPAT